MTQRLRGDVSARAYGSEGMSLRMSAGGWRSVTKAAPCLRCGKGDWCSVSADGAIGICRRTSGGSGERIDASGSPYIVFTTGSTILPEVSIPAWSPTPVAAPSAVLDAVYRELIRALPVGPDHRHALRQRGLGDGEIELRGYRSLPVQGRSGLARWLVTRFGAGTCSGIPGLYLKAEKGRSWWSLAGPAGLLVPVRDVGRRIVALKVRADDRERSGGKYVYVSSAKYGGAGSGSRVHVPLFEGSTTTVRLTEGELKADVATVLDGVLTVSAPGVTSWRSVIPILHSLNAARVSIAFDSDADSNVYVAGALEAALHGLRAEGFDVAVEAW